MTPLDHPSVPTRAQLLQRSLGIAVLYLLLGALGLSFAVAPGYASPIFPAAGFAVAVLLWTGWRGWGGIWLGSFVLNLGLAWMHNDLGARSAMVAANIATGSTLQALLAWVLIQRWVPRGWRTMEVEREIVLCLALAGPLASLVSASVGVAVLYLAQVLPAPALAGAWWSWWSGDTLGVLVMLPLCLTLLYRHDSPWRARLRLLVLPMLATLALVALAFMAASRWELAQQKAAIRSQGETWVKLLEQRFIAHQEALAALRRLIEVTPNMTFAQFEYFTRITLHDNPDIFALSINPYVLQPQRAAFEHSMAQKTGVAGFEIKERDSQRKLVRAAERADYVAVGYIAPLQGNRPAIGFDIHSEPVRRDAIGRAKASAKPAATAPIQLVQENQKRVGILLLHPSYLRTDEARGTPEQGALAAFSVGVIKVDEMVEIATRSSQVPGLVLQVSDASAPAEQARIFHSGVTDAEPDARLVWQQQVAVADRHWTVRVVPTAAYLREGRHWTALAVGLAGLVLAALLQVLLLVITGRAVLIQRRVAEQTAELQVRSEVIEDRNAQLSALFRLSPDGLVAIAPDGKVKFATPSFESMTGITLDQVVGADTHALDAALRQRCAHPEEFAGIAAFFGDGGDTLAHQTLTLAAPRGAVLQVVGVRSESPSVARLLYLRDVTHETEVDAMKSEFLSTAAHELRTPMSSIYGFSEVLLHRDLDKESQQEFLGIIHRQSELMVSILNELLDLARIEARRGKDFVFRKVEVQAVVAEVAGAFKVPSGRAAPLLVMPDVALCIRADHQKVQQAVLNVLSNAYKYSPDGGDVTVRVEVAGGGVDADSAPQNGGAGAARIACIRVTDQGMGLSPEQISHVCERFYRADTSGKVLGTGLGMSIVKEIVELHQGRLHIDSVLGAGTTVSLLFPLQDA